MSSVHQLLGTALLAVMFLGCGSTVESESELIGRTSQAINVCNETVPEERYVDGFPAYAQCDGGATGEIWSNNGIDTATSSQGPDWIRTQRSGGYQCTELVRRYLHFRWGIDYQNGDAGEWCDGELPDTLTISSTPVHGDLIVFQGGVCGAAQSTGHIAVVDEVDQIQGKVTFIEQNRASRRTSDQSCGLCFLHAVANDGSAGASGLPGAGGTPGGGGGETGGMGGTGGSLASGGSTSIAGASSGGTAGFPASGGGAASGGSPGLPASGGAVASGTGGAQPSSDAAAKPPGSAVASNEDTKMEGTACGVAIAARDSGASLTALICVALGALFRRRRAPRNTTTRPRA